MLLIPKGVFSADTQETVRAAIQGGWGPTARLLVIMIVAAIAVITICVAVRLLLL